MTKQQLKQAADEGIVDFDGYEPTIETAYQSSRFIVISNTIENKTTGEIIHLTIIPKRGHHKPTIGNLEHIKDVFAGNNCEAMYVMKRDKRDRQTKVRHLWVMPEGFYSTFTERLLEVSRGKQTTKADEHEPGV